MKEIFERRSVRTYTDRDITPDEEERLLRAGMQAPSAGNEQPWHFIVIRSRGTMQKINESQPYAKMLEKAPLCIAVCGDRRAQSFPFDFWVQDCSAAIQNMLLEAEHLGLGGVWLGVYPVPERVSNISALLGLPEDVLPLGLLAFGQPAGHPEPVDRFLPERVHKENW